MIAKFVAVNWEARRRAMETLAPFHPVNVVQDGNRYTVTIDDNPIGISQRLSVKHIRRDGGFVFMTLDTFPVITVSYPYVERIRIVAEFVCSICGQNITNRDGTETGHSSECPVSCSQLKEKTR